MLDDKVPEGKVLEGKVPEGKVLLDSWGVLCPMPNDQYILHFLKKPVLANLSWL